jgi:RNA polymerase sigma factor (TIGR02999 family)
MLIRMSDVTQILQQIEQGDPAAAEQLLPLVYNELRKLASAKLANEKSGQTLQATALVHEAYIRLLGAEAEQNWDSRGHFFGAAAEAMRRILVDKARKKKTTKHGGQLQRVELRDAATSDETPADELLALDKALTKLQERDEVKAELVKLRYFAGLTIPQAAEVLGIGASTADKYWAYSKSWLRTEISKSS